MSSSDAPIVSLAHVSLVFEGGVRALDDVSLDVMPGERLCVLGPNGSGKSTLASVVCGLLAPDEGDVTLAGERVCVGGQADYQAYRYARRDLGLVFQNPDDQIVTSVVEDDVAFGPENLGLAPEEIERRVRRELHRVALQDLALADPTHLSGGQKQRVAIAGALAMRPRVLVLDEPGALLDVRGRRGVMHVLDGLRETGTATVHVTHFMDEALAADRVVVLDRGRIALEGTPREVFAHEGELRALGLDEPFAGRLAAALRERGVAVPWTCDEGELMDALAELLAGTVPDGTRWAPAGRAAGGAAKGGLAGTAPALELDHVSYSYHDLDARSASQRALSDVSLSVPMGSTCAIVGQTGSGKSTLLRLLAALEAPDAGVVRVGGTPTTARRVRRSLQGTVGFVMQRPERQLFAETVREDVAFGPTNLRLPAQEVARRTDEALAVVGLSERAGASPFQLSGGQRRLCAIAGVLALDPATVVLDEPAAGLDPRGRRDVRAVLRRIGERGTTVVEVTHSMDSAARADQVVVLDRSRVLAQGTPAEVFAPGNAQALHEAGLGLPSSVRWAQELAERGAGGLGAPLTLEALADALAAQANEAPAGAGEQHGEGLPGPAHPAGATTPPEGRR